MDKLIVLPGSSGLGGMTVSLSMMVRGFEKLGASGQLCLLVKSGSLVEQYLCQTGQEHCVEIIPAQNGSEFIKLALRWVAKQPSSYPLLLETCTSRNLLSSMILAAPQLRLSGRPVYHVFRDLALSYNPLGNYLRKLAFTCLSPQVICNSRFTAEQIERLLPGVGQILYPPVDTDKFNQSSRYSPPPANLQPILASGARILLTPRGLANQKALTTKICGDLFPC